MCTLSSTVVMDRNTCSMIFGISVENTRRNQHFRSCIAETRTPLSVCKLFRKFKVTKLSEIFGNDLKNVHEGDFSLHIDVRTWYYLYPTWN